MDDEPQQSRGDDLPVEITRAAFFRRRGLLGAAGGMMLLAACGKESGTSTGSSKSGAKGPDVRNQNVNALGLTLFGAMAEAPSMKEWTSANNIKVEAAVSADDSQSIAKLAAGGTQQYNLVAWISQWRHGWFAADVLQPIDTSRIPNLANVIPNFGGPEDVAATKDAKGNTLGVPIYWNVLGIAYDSAKMSAPKSYYDMLDPSFAGKIIMFDAGGAVMSLGCQALGIKMETITRPQLAQVKELLLKFVKQTRTIAKSPADAANILASGDALACVPASLVVPANAAKAGRDSIRVQTHPKEGAVSWVAMIGIPKGAKNTDVAYEYINRVLTKDVASYWTTKYGALPSVQGAQDSVPDWFKAAVAVNDLPSVWQGAPATFFPPQQPTVSDGVGFQAFINAWQEVKAEAGRS